MKKIIIRQIQEADVPAVLGIYTPYITQEAVSFELEAPSACEFKNRVETISAEYPYLVCVIDGKIAGYAYAYKQRERAAYQWNAELSVYIDKSYHRRGIGRAFYHALIDILKLQNIKTVYGGVAVPNPGSEQLHESMGFEKLVVYRNVGYKCGAWRDVAWFEKSIGDYEYEPKPFAPITEINKSSAYEIMCKCCDKIKP